MSHENNETKAVRSKSTYESRDGFGMLSHQMLEYSPWRIKEHIVMNNLDQASRLTRTNICNIWEFVSVGSTTEVPCKCG